VIDINDLTALNGVLRPEMTDDGLHLNARGCAVWLSAVRALMSGAAKP
jgi:hypothetical protein